MVRRGLRFITRAVSSWFVVTAPLLIGSELSQAVGAMEGTRDEATGLTQTEAPALSSAADGDSRSNGDTTNVVFTKKGHDALPATRHETTVVVKHGIDVEPSSEDKIEIEKQGEDSLLYKLGFLVMQICAFVYAFGGLALSADHMVNSMETLCARNAIPEDVGGASFMAFGSAIPEIMVNAISTYRSTGRRRLLELDPDAASPADLGIGGILGSGFIAFLLIPSLCIWFSPRRAGWRQLVLKRSVVQRDTLFYAVALVLLIVALHFREATLLFSFALLAVYGLYLAALFRERRRYSALSGDNGGDALNAAADDGIVLAHPAESTLRYSPPVADRNIELQDHASIRQTDLRGAAFEQGCVDTTDRQTSATSSTTASSSENSVISTADYNLMVEPDSQHASPYSVRYSLPARTGLQGSNTDPASGSRTLDVASASRRLQYDDDATDDSGTSNARSLFFDDGDDDEADDDLPDGLGLMAEHASTSLRVSTDVVPGFGPPFAFGDTTNTTSHDFSLDPSTLFDDSSGSTATSRTVGPWKRCTSICHLICALCLSARLKMSRCAWSPSFSGVSICGPRRRRRLRRLGILAELLIRRVFAPVDFLLRKTCPDCREGEPWERFYAVTFFTSFAWISLFSYVITELSCAWVDALGVPSMMAFFGICLVAVGAEIPDAVNSVTVARRGLGSMAVSACVGSQIANICLGLGLSWFLACAVDGAPVEIGRHDRLIQVASRAQLANVGLFYAVTTLFCNNLRPDGTVALGVRHTLLFGASYALWMLLFALVALLGTTSHVQSAIDAS
ncbi:unnamed protein product [Amoebophrya sp. A25]|nr:unnamed protein product [Amoebophrya sp. A25]|eukprot:GSA25T00016720001.1